MSTSPNKKDVPIKLETQNNSLPSGVDGTVTSTTSPSKSSGWQDIPLKACSKKEVDDIRFHIMKFQSTRDVDIMGDFSRPVRLHRKDPRNIQFQLTRAEIDKRKREQEEERLKQDPDGKIIIKDELDEEGEVKREYGQSQMDMSQVAPDGGARKAKKNMFKRKTRQINSMNDTKRKLRYEEHYPWVVEDYEGKNVFVGNYEAGSSDTTHVLFVFDKDGFKMVPAEKVYRFTPRNKYATLTLEEAEEKMEKNLSVPRWLMKRMEEGASVDTAAPDLRFKNGGSSSTAINSDARKNSKNNGRGQLRTVLGDTNGRDSDHDDLDFDEEFADDEEAPIMEGDEEENKFSEKKIKKDMLKSAHFDVQSDGEDDLDDLFDTETRKVDKEGKKLKKLLNKTEGGVYDSDDEDDKLNPYLSKSDMESDDDDSDMEDIIKKETENGAPSENQVRAFTASNLGEGFVLIKAPTNFLQGFPRGEWTPHGRKRAASTSIPSPQKKPRLDEGRSPNKIKIKLEGTRSASPTPERMPPTVEPVPAAPVAVDLNSSGPGNTLVTVKEVLDIVRDNPLTTKELLFSLKARVSSHKDNKLRIISIVKQNLRLTDGKLVLKE